MRKVIGIGETILDILFLGDNPVAAVPGGSSFNGIVSLARAGVPTCFVSETGEDEVGRKILRFMEREGIGTEYVGRFSDGKSPVSLAFLDEDNEASYLFYKNYPALRLQLPRLPEIQAGDLVLYGAYYSLNPVLRPKVLSFLEYARRAGAILYYTMTLISALRTRQKCLRFCRQSRRICAWPTWFAAQSSTSSTFTGWVLRKSFIKKR